MRLHINNYFVDLNKLQFDDIQKYNILNIYKQLLLNDDIKNIIYSDEAIELVDYIQYMYNG